MVSIRDCESLGDGSNPFRHPRLSLSSYSEIFCSYQTESQVQFLY